MKIVYVTSEALPFAASSDLAVVAGALPKALVAEGHECIVVMPLYGKTMKPERAGQLNFVQSFSVPVGWRSQYCGILTTTLDGVTFYFVDNEYYFKRDFGLYGYDDDAERYAFFSRAVLETIEHLALQPDIIHVNDWQTALVPIYYSIYYKYKYRMRDIRTVFTIHNIEHQGRHGHDILESVLSIPRHMKSIVDYDGDVNLMKGAIEISDKITTVSVSYACEILDPWFSHGLDRILKSVQYKTCGFLNGIDTTLHNPEKDRGIPATFHATSKEGKTTCKAKLLETCGLHAGDDPVIGMISRFEDHKGLDLVEVAFDRIIGAGFKLVILGAGDVRYETFFSRKRDQYPDKVHFTCGVVPAFEKRIHAGSDMLLIPSRSEPCGFAQMIALRYGTIPIVRAVGGLRDSVRDCGDPDGTGYTFHTPNADDMFGAICRAKNDYLDKKRWSNLVDRALEADFSWAVSAKLYIGLYEELVARKN